MDPQIRPHRGIASRPIPSDIEPNIALSDAERLEVYRKNLILQPFARDLARKVRSAHSAYRRELMLSFVSSVASLFGLSGTRDQHDLNGSGDAKHTAPSAPTSEREAGERKSASM